jgi:hypothetical protein
MSGDIGKNMEKEGGIVWNLGTKVPKPCSDCMGKFGQTSICLEDTFAMANSVSYIYASWARGFEG